MGHSQHGCLGFTTSRGVTNGFGYTPTNCVLTNYSPRSRKANVPCEEGFKCCTMVTNTRSPTTARRYGYGQVPTAPTPNYGYRQPSAPPTPPPTRHRYCPAGYADYGVRFSWGLGRITVAQTHAACAARCTEYSHSRYNGGCKGYMTGMYFGMLFCRSYGGLEYGTMACAHWAVPWNPGAYSGELGTVHDQTQQMNVGGNCCMRTSSVVDFLD